jgi:arylsulfatase A-like enzyme
VPSASAAEPIRPNFVLIVTDDQRWDTIGRCLGGFDGLDLAAGADSCMPEVQQRLVASGVTFRQGQVTQSLCCPSRASILTGQLSTHTDVTQVQGFDSFDDGSTLATWLHDAGYRTGLFGKYLNGYGDSQEVPANYVPPGWDSWHAFYGYDGVSDDPYTDYPWIDREPGGDPVQTRHLDADSTTEAACAPGNLYSTDLICSLGLDFLSADEEQPFFLYVAPVSPHEPATPADRWAGFYEGVQPPRYPNHNTVPSPNPPAYLPTAPLAENQIASMDNSFRKTLEANRAVDDMLAALHDRLSTDGRLDETVFIFISDNGLSAGEQRWTTKQCEYDACHRVPFIVVCPPAICPGGQMGRIDEQHHALNIDIAPTVAELAGVTPTLRVDGLSLLPLLDDPGAAWRDEWLLHDQANPLDGIVATLDDGHVYKYVEFADSGETELFDLTIDPWELSNLAGDGSATDVQTELATALADSIHPPGVWLTSAPGPATNETDVSFGYQASEQSTFECVLDGSAPQPCGSGTSGGATYAGLTQGSHTFSVVAVDRFNNVSAPAESFVLVDTSAPPSPTLTQVPPEPSGADAQFSFTDAEAGVTFSCSMDAGPAQSCTAPFTYDTLADGTHVFSVTAVDAAGNASQPTIFSWTVNGSNLTVTMTTPTPDALTTRTRIDVIWIGLAGIVRYDLYERVGVAGAPVLVQSSSALSFRRTGVPGATYCYRLYAHEADGSVATSEERCTAVPWDDRSAAIVYSGSIAQVAVTKAFQGTVTVLDAAGEQASVTGVVRKFGVLVQTNAASGLAEVVVDGQLVATVDLYARRTRNLVYVFSTILPTASHTITVSWTGAKNAASSGSAIWLDGIAVLG